jgi:hypothetical protein
MKQDALSTLLFNFTLVYVIRRVQVNQDGFKLNDAHQLVVYADDVYNNNNNNNLLCVHQIHTGLGTHWI